MKKFNWYFLFKKNHQLHHDIAQAVYYSISDTKLPLLDSDL